MGFLKGLSVGGQAIVIIRKNNERQFLFPCGLSSEVKNKKLKNRLSHIFIYFYSTGIFQSSYILV